MKFIEVLADSEFIEDLLQQSYLAASVEPKRLQNSSMQRSPTDPSQYWPLSDLIL